MWWLTRCKCSPLYSLSSSAHQRIFISFSCRLCCNSFSSASSESSKKKRETSSSRKRETADLFSRTRRTSSSPSPSSSVPSLSPDVNSRTKRRSTRPSNAVVVEEAEFQESASEAPRSINNQTLSRSIKRTPKPEHFSSASNMTSAAANPTLASNDTSAQQQQQPLSGNPFASPRNVSRAWESAQIEQERKKAKQLLSKLTQKEVELEEKDKSEISISPSPDERDALRKERERERAVNKAKRRKAFQLFKNGMDNVTDTEALAALFSDMGNVNIQDELRKGLAAYEEAQKRGAAATEEEEEDDESEFSGSDIEYDSDGDPIVNERDTQEATRLEGTAENDENEAIQDADLEIKEPGENETEAQKEQRIESEKAAFEFQRHLVMQELMMRDLPQIPLQAAPNSILVGDVLMPWPFKPDPTKIVRVAVLGTPNCGKSSLVNAMTGTKVTAVSPKRNTTRMKTLGVCTRHDTQMVLYDTPGILELEGAKKYERDLTAEAWDATTRADVVVVLIDAVKRIGPAEHSLILKAKKWQQETKRPCLLVLNKCDLEHPKSKLIETADDLMEICDFTEVYYISASLNKFVDGLQEYLFGLAQPGPWQFPADEASALSEKQRAAEIIREKIYCRLNQEIPYAVTQLNDDWKDLPDGSLAISQRLLVETPVQQSILIGKQGAVINTIKEAAEKDLTSIMGRSVVLKLTVGVK